MFVKAILTKEVKYSKLGLDVILKAGTPVELDTGTEICLVDKKDHVQLGNDDYKVIEN